MTQKLSFISDEALLYALEHLLTTADEAQKKASKNFSRNVIDPFALLFEMSGFQVDQETWTIGEKRRQAQKTLQNQVGAFHQKILGAVDGWNDLETGAVVDIVSAERKIIAEIKDIITKSQAINK